MMDKDTPTSQHDYSELQKAIAVINKYSEQKVPLQGTAETIKHFKQTIREIASLFLRKLLNKRPPEPKNQDDPELTKALETIKNHYLLIEKLKHGTPEEQKLAQLAFDSIKSYNENLEANAPSPHWSDKISKLLSTTSFPPQAPVSSKKIQLPFTATTNISKKQHSIDKLQHAFSKVACTINKKSSKSRKLKISTQEMDLFRMKAITLLRDHKLKVKRESVQKAPIIVQSEDTDKGIVSLFQTITPFPGETIELKGKFKRNPENKERPIPIPDSFHLSTSSTQTGYPHPSQYNGWSLSVQLIPVCPHRLDVMTHFNALQEKRKKLANTLLPMGKNNRHAKEILKLKKESFDSNKNEFLPLQKTLSEAIIKRSFCENCPLEPVKNYYDLLTSLPYAYDYLSETYSIINDKLIKTPYNRLQEERLLNPNAFNDINHTKKFLLQEVDNQIKQLDDDLVQATTDFERYTLSYIQLMGRALTNGTISIILQELSENLSFAPPLLDEFSREIQYSAYKHLTVFLDELTTHFTGVEEMSAHLRRLITEDITLFKGDQHHDVETISAILNELEEYYNQRYFSRRQGS